MATERPTPTGPAAPELSIVESRVYRGGNVWSYDPAIHLVVDLGVLEGYPTDTLEGFTDRLLELLPAGAVVLTFGDVPLADVDDGVDRHRRREDQLAHGSTVSRPASGGTIGSATMNIEP